MFSTCHVEKVCVKQIDPLLRAARRHDPKRDHLLCMESYSIAGLIFYFTHIENYSAKVIRMGANR